MDKVKVLYIDDEVSNLNAFKASFRRQFAIYLARSADEGMEILKNIPIEVVIADQIMPNKTGVDFFESILDLYPNPIRILLTAYSDINAVIDSINRGHVYRYITKPWNDYELKLTIENAYHLYHLKEQNNKLDLKYRTIFSKSTDPIVIFDDKGRIIDYNKATLLLLNDKEEDLNFSSLNSLIQDKKETKHIINIIKEKGVLKDYECEITVKDNDKRICLISGNAVTNSYGRIVSYQAIIKDITERTQMNQLLLKKIIETQEDERKRIARDLHDGIGQSLVAVKLHIEGLKNNYNKNNDIKKELNIIPQLIHHSIGELRRVCFDTLPLFLQEYGLIKAIQELKSTFSNLDFKIIFKYDKELPELTNPLEISIFRIIQEFMNNSIKHSEATEVNINIKNKKNNIILNLKDNGIGFNIDDIKENRGQGLKNIKTRVDSFKGKLEINSITDKGTEFKIAFPTLYI